jgi:hypothetical protein
MVNANSSAAEQRPTRSTLAGERQSYLLLAFGLLIAVAFPYFLRPRAAVSIATPTTASASAPSRAHR